MRADPCQGQWRVSAGHRFGTLFVLDSQACGYNRTVSLSLNTSFARFSAILRLVSYLP